MPTTVVQLPPGGVPQVVGQLPAGVMPQVVGQLPPAGKPPTVGKQPRGRKAPAVGKRPRGGKPPTVGQLPPQGVPPIVVQLTPEGLLTVLEHLPPGWQQLPLLLLLPGGMKPGMPPPNAPAHYWDHPPVAGTMQPQQCGQPPQPAGSCPLQAASQPGPSTVLQGPPVQQRVRLVPGTLPTILEQPEELEDQGQPAPIGVCPHPNAAPLSCSIAALESGAATTSADIPEDITDIGDLLAWMNSELAPKEVPDDIPGTDEDAAECPAPACTPSGHQQSAGSIRATKRKLPQSQDAPEQKRSR
ncbi:proline-rich protein HaeIII subfamily 1-like [Tympanuchus pallidicinctus]|uniref:proline-rich protein HaeIII subfamily 1-like n=1 Tax=Tympanuchus pallidicinctus TaxID=109042 RepID=UPI0022876757|nr:proline-rich protein HaeIII subfamily 1-like [Tympanuchus pallidicinctus]